MIREFRDAGASASRQRVIASDHHRQRIGPDHARLQTLRGFDGRQRDHGQFVLAVSDGVVGLFRIHEFDREPHQRVATHEGAQHRRQPVQADVMAGRERERSADGSRQITDRPFGVLDLVDDALRARQQASPTFGQRYVTADAIEESYAEACLEQRNPLADRRLGEVKALGSQRKRLARSNCKEGTQQFGVHRMTIWNPIHENNEFVLLKAVFIQ
jgi:hypothetical protein